MIDTWREDRMWEETSLVKIYNYIKSIFDFIYQKVDPRRKMFERLFWETVYWNTKKNIYISRGNITINYLSHKDFVQLSEAGYPGLGFDHLKS